MHSNAYLQINPEAMSKTLEHFCESAHQIFRINDFILDFLVEL